MSAAVAAEYEFTIPARHVLLFRRAVAEELHNDANWVAEQSNDLATLLDSGWPPVEKTEVRVIDLDGSMRHIQEDRAIFEQVRGADGKQDVTITAPDTALQGVFERMIRCSARNLTVAAGYSPIDVDDIAHVLDGLRWTVSQLDQMNTPEEA